MTFEKQPLAECPKCGALALRVIEGRPSKLAMRRRKQCDECKHRVTTHEISDEFFQAAKSNEIAVLKMQQLLATYCSFMSKHNGTSASKCGRCIYNNGSVCGFSLPEFATDESADCNYFQARGTDHD